MAEQSLRLGECDTALVAAADLLLDEMPFLKLSASGALSPASGAGSSTRARTASCSARARAPSCSSPGQGARRRRPGARGRGVRGGQQRRPHHGPDHAESGRAGGSGPPCPGAGRRRPLRHRIRRGPRHRDDDRRPDGTARPHQGVRLGRRPARVLRGRQRQVQHRSHADGGGHGGAAEGRPGAAAPPHPADAALRDAQPRFDFGRSPFFPNTELRDFTPVDGVRRAGVSAFGFGASTATRSCASPARPSSPGVRASARACRRRSSAGPATGSTGTYRNPHPPRTRRPPPPRLPLPRARGCTAAGRPILPLEELN